ncbi:hypothetical protein N7536_007993 [Penicillium majusculum]|nr:hypothetical protein N7536_007993 [Penicillium majusculum]
MVQISVRCLQDNSKKIQGPTLTIIVGASKEPFQVHESIICTSSLFFKKAMSGSRKESKEHTLELPEDDPQVFALYSHWLYFSTIPVVVERVAKKKLPENSAREYNDLIKAYLLGDKLLDTNFQNSVIDAIIEQSTTTNPDEQRYYPGEDAVKHVYHNTTESATIRKLLVDMYVDTAAPNWLHGELPKEFLYSVTEGLMKKRVSSCNPIKASKYHVQPSSN